MKTKLTLPPRINMSPLFMEDAYKLSHADQYPKNVVMVYSNLTPRRSRNAGDRFVFFGLQAWLLQLNEIFHRDFFNQKEEFAITQFYTDYFNFFGFHNEKEYERVRQLHRFGTLPLLVKALPEGSAVPHGVPVLTIQNTHPDFYWLTNHVETWLSAAIWHPSTSATTAWNYRKLLDKYAKETSDSEWFVDFQAHDFSMRGQTSVASATASGAAHLTSFKGTDTLPAIRYIKTYYGGDLLKPGEIEDGNQHWANTNIAPIGVDLIGTSIPASEHSIQCCGGPDGDFDYLKRFVTEVYPSGMFSIVADGYDFWKFVTEYLPMLKNEIMARDGKVIIRPDSSPKTPVEIICGDPEAPICSPEWYGLIQCLWDIFGGTRNSKEYKELDSHIGAIYGDSITLEYAEQICARLKAKGFASTNICLGVGSYTYQMVTRDTHGIAMKATAVGISETQSFDDMEIVPIFKDPKTDNSGKKSAKGLLKVNRVSTLPCRECENRNPYMLFQQGDATYEFFLDGLETVYEDGILVKYQTFGDIRKTLLEQV